MTKNLADNLGPHGINVNVIHPGLTYTERSISSLTNILNKLDELSIQQKRKITIPLIKEII